MAVVIKIPPTAEIISSSALPQDFKITRLAFLERFTDAEAVAIDLAGQGATVEAAKQTTIINNHTVVGSILL